MNYKTIEPDPWVLAELKRITDRAGLIRALAAHSTGCWGAFNASSYYNEYGDNEDSRYRGYESFDDWNNDMGEYPRDQDVEEARREWDEGKIEFEKSRDGDQRQAYARLNACKIAADRMGVPFDVEFAVEMACQTTSALPDWNESKC